MKVVLGFTGTSKEVTDEQYGVLKNFIKALRPVEVHHGDCIGADELFHKLVNKVLDYPVVINIHPPDNPTKRAYCHHHGQKPLVVEPEKPYLERNHDIVDACTRLVAVPAEGYEVLRSGTWATVRYAKKVGRPVTIIYPNGESEQRP